ncbi:MAG: AEC family transporter [Lentimicrobiaceae bacterium]|jgi:predicted permease|nr:AEC family transporter [Lentimicrobiaceae bacterium]
MQAIIGQIVILTTIGIIGWVAIRSKIINQNNVDGLVKVILKITLPLLIFTTFSGTKLNKEMLAAFPFIFGAAFVSVLVLFFLSKVSARFQKLNRENTALHNTSTMFGNVAFLGYPLLNAVFPNGEGLIYATIFQLGHDSLMWTWGIFILNKGAQQKSAQTWKHMINPTTIAFLIGILFLILKIEIPYLLFEPLHGLGHTTIYLSMIYVGAVLATVNAKTLFTNVRSYIVSFNKLILCPLIVLLCFYVLKKVGISIPFSAMSVAVLQSAMPCMIIVSILAKELGLNAKQSVENIFISSVLSIATLPFIYFLIQKFLSS